MRRRSGLVGVTSVAGAIVGSSLAISVAAVLPASAVPAGINGKIAFSRYDSTTHTRHMFAMNSDGTAPTQLTNGAGELDSGAAWSPDGSRIAFSRGTTASGSDHIFVMDADGTEQTQLTTDPHTIAPAWSPDGSKIAFERTNSADADGIYVMNSDGTGVIRLTDQPHDHAPDWSPDGSRIAFQRKDPDNNTFEIFAMDADGANQINLTHDWSGNDEDPSWSPDGSKIAFTSNRDFNPEIYVMDADGTNQVNMSSNASTDSSPAWSPDGSNIAFISGRDGSYDVFAMGADGADQTNLNSDAAADSAPGWGPVFTPPPPPIPLTSTATAVSLGTPARVGAGLTAVLSGSWQAGTSTLNPRFQWYVVSSTWAPIPGATNANFIPTPAQYNQHIAVKVTAAAPSGYETPATLTSLSVPVMVGLLRTATPRIRGVARVGRTLRASPGSWLAGPVILSPTHFRYRWYVGNRLVAHSTSATLKLTRAMLGRRVKVRVEGWYSFYATAYGLSLRTKTIGR
jgi:Tol biopolymer transport system component